MSARVEPVLTRTSVPAIPFAEAPAKTSSGTFAADHAPAAPYHDAGPRRDPAPSRTAYRLHRLWLTPLFRGLLHKGVPVFLLVFGAGLWIQDDARRGAILEWLTSLRQTVAERPEFMVNTLEIAGVSDTAAARIRAALALDLPVSSWALDLDALRARVLDIDAVARARLQIREGGILEVAAREREPVVVWRSASGIGTLDVDGHPVAALASRLERADLPLIVGEDANRHVPEALAILKAGAPIGERIRGMVREGERRWDVIVDPAIRLLLPAEAPAEALEQIVALDEAQYLLSRDIVRVDLRIPSRPTVQMNAPAAETFRQNASLPRGAKE